MSSLSFVDPPAGVPNFCRLRDGRTAGELVPGVACGAVSVDVGVLCTPVIDVVVVVESVVLRDPPFPDAAATAVVVACSATFQRPWWSTRSSSV